ncbi:MAG: LysE family transporter, partial [Succinatimonas sp.]|nr:LysE family transporter [Succinatimonas sp.]
YIAISTPDKSNKNKIPTFRTGFILQLVNVKIYFYISTLLSVYFIPYIEGLQGLLLAGVGVVAVGSFASLVWAFMGVQLQSIYEKYHRIINYILAAFLLYCAWDIIREVI